MVKRVTFPLCNDNCLNWVQKNKIHSAGKALCTSRCAQKLKKVIKAKDLVNLFQSSLVFFVGKLVNGGEGIKGNMAIKGTGSFQSFRQKCLNPSQTTLP